MSEFNSYDDAGDELRCVFAAFALQGMMANVDAETLENEHQRRFIAKTCFEIADMMMGVRRESTRH